MVGFNGFVDYVENNKEINKLLQEHPDYRLYGEWLVKHTISYNELAYKKFYLFDIEADGEFLQRDLLRILAELYLIPTPLVIATAKNPTIETLRMYVGTSELGEVGEGIVIKNDNFVNKFGSQQYAKLVSQKFKEDNCTVFGGNNKTSESYNEQYIVNKYCTLERVTKILHKIEPTIDGRLGKEHTPRVSSSVHHDIMTEEIWEIQKKFDTISFNKLRKLILKKAIMIYHEILDNDISVAHKQND